MYQAGLFDGRVAIITGGGSGLGKAMALRLAELGAAVGIVGRREGKLQEVVDQITASGGRAALATADVRAPQSVEAAFASIEGQLGPIDTLVNNAAGNFLAPSEDLSANAFDAVVQIVLYGTFHCTQAFARKIIDDPARKGHILNITTTYAWTGSPFVLPSASAKAGVLAMTRSLAVEWATYGIRVNAIAPGPIPTEGAFSRLMVGDMEKAALARVPAGRFGTKRELADLAVYLLSEQAAWVTGEVVTIDGGEWLQSGAEFGEFVKQPRAQVKAALAAMKPR